MRKTMALLVKDLYLHRGEILGSWGCLVGFIGLLFLVAPPDTLEQKVLILANGNFFLNLFYSEFLIYREKTKGTLVWLRSMPLSDGHITSAKFLGQALLQVVGFTLTTALLAPTFLVEAPAGFAILLLFLIAYGGIFLMTRWFLNQRTGMAIPILLLIVGLGCYRYARVTRPDVVAWIEQVAWPTATFKLALCLVEVAWVALLWLLLNRLLAARDTWQLVD